MPDDEKDPKINPNTASVEDLTALPGVGESLAKRIRAGGPYQAEVDLLQVSGVGDALLRRISSELTFESIGDDGPVQVSDTQQSQSPAKSSVPLKAAGRQPRILLWCLTTALISVLLSISLTLAILLSINGTLNMGRHVRVQQLSEQLSGLEGDVADAQSQLKSTDQQLQALSGLSGRMADVEDALSEATARMDDARQRVDDMQSTVEQLDATSERLAGRVDRFDQFLNGLRDLLNTEATAPSSSTGPIP